MFQITRTLSVLSLVVALFTGCGNGKCDPSLPNADHFCPEASEITATPEADEAPVGDDDDDNSGDDDAAGDDDNSGDDDSSVNSPTPDVESTPSVEVETPTPEGDDATPIVDTSTPEVEETPIQVTPTPEDEETATPVVEPTPEVTPSAEETPAEISPTPVVTPIPEESGDDDVSTPSPAPTEPPDEEEVEVDTDGDGYLVSEGDCVEGDADTYPGAPELQDWIDNDCNDKVDDGCSSACQWDYLSYHDGQGYCRDDLYTFWASASTDFTWECTGSTWYVQLDADKDGYDSAKDCNDAKASINPGAPELMNWVDDDCNGLVDDGCNVSCSWDYVSLDANGTQCRDDLYAYKSTNSLTWECTGDSWRVEVDVDADGYVASTGDCSEGDPDTYPGAPELQDWIDNDCDKQVDDGCSTSCNWDYVSVAEDGTQCRDDLYAFWSSESYDWKCTGVSWRASP